jgi:hypothetical protein
VLEVLSAAVEMAVKVILFALDTFLEAVELKAPLVADMLVLAAAMEVLGGLFPIPQVVAPEWV